MGCARSIGMDPRNTLLVGSFLQRNIRIQPGVPMSAQAAWRSREFTGVISSRRWRPSGRDPHQSLRSWWGLGGITDGVDYQRAGQFLDLEQAKARLSLLEFQSSP